MALSNKTRIQQALMALGRAGPYYQVNYAAGGSDPVQVETTGATPTPTQDPSSVACNEINCSFEVDQRYGRSEKRDRTVWTFNLICKFDREVTSEFAEEIWTDNPPTLPRDASNGLRQAVLQLTDAVYQHPTRRGSSGTLVTFTFEARLSRR